MRITEGGIEVEVAEPSHGEIGDAVFYNPRQEQNRDITIAVLRAFRKRESAVQSYLDAMAASGIRGIRAAADGWTVTACDRDPDAVARCEENFARNDLTGTIERADANVLMQTTSFDVVDLDPFGTPIPYADAAFTSARSLLCVTATDTAPLCGAHFRAGIRRYSAIPRTTEYHREIGLRMLLSALCRTAARYDLAARPLLSYTEPHYARTYLSLSSGAGRADAVIDELGTLSHCPECLHRDWSLGILDVPFDECPACDGTNVLSAGPLWLGDACEQAFVTESIGNIDARMGTASASRATLETVRDELQEPMHFDQHVLCKRWNRSAPGMDAFLTALHDAGYEATRAHYGGTSFKTDAPVDEIRRLTVDLHETS